MDFDSPDTNVRSTPRKTKDVPHLYPVSPGDSGEGLPYAPEDWPNPGDKWRWKAGKRVIGSGYIWDRYLYLPSRLVKAGQPKSFRSKYSVEQYVQSAFPSTDVNAFFASFRWNIPLKQLNSKELLGADSHLAHTCCKAGNNMCISLSRVSDPLLSEAMFCDICCSEPDFCRNCCCILCSKTIFSAFGSYNYIRCKAILFDGCICGHIAHIDCALRAHMVGTVGGSYELDAEYFCRRCDSRTDLVSHIMELLQICEFIDSRDEIEKILNSAISILHGSKKMNARQLLHHIESVMAKLKNGANFEDMWEKEEAVLEVITAQPKVTKKKRTTRGKPRKDNAKGKRQRTTTEPNAPDTDNDFTISPTSFLHWLESNSISTPAAQPKVTKKRRTTHGKPRKDNAKGKKQRTTTEPNVPDTDNDFTISPILFLHKLQSGKDWNTTEDVSNMQIVTAGILNICAALNEMTIEGGSQTVVDNEAALHIEVVDILCIETQLQLDEQMDQQLNNEELQQDIQLSFSSDSMFRNDEEGVVVHGNSNDEEAVVVHGNSVLSEELKRVKTWRSWRLMHIEELIQNIDMMINEEHFALRWLNTNDISQALRLNYINEVYMEKLSELKKAEKGKEVLPKVEGAFNTLSEEIPAQIEETNLSRTLQISTLDFQRAPGETLHDVETTAPVELSSINVEAERPSEPENTQTDNLTVIDVADPTVVVTGENEEKEDNNDKDELASSSKERWLDEENRRLKTGVKLSKEELMKKHAEEFGDVPYGEANEEEEDENDNDKTDKFDNFDDNNDDNEGGAPGVVVGTGATSVNTEVPTASEAQAEQTERQAEELNEREKESKDDLSAAMTSSQPNPLEMSNILFLPSPIPLSTSEDINTSLEPRNPIQYQRSSPVHRFKRLDADELSFKRDLYAAVQETHGELNMQMSMMTNFGEAFRGIFTGITGQKAIQNEVASQVKSNVTDELRNIDTTLRTQLSLQGGEIFKTALTVDEKVKKLTQLHDLEVGAYKLEAERMRKEHKLEVDALKKKIEQLKAQLTALTTQVGNLNSTMSTNVVPTLNSLVAGQLEAFDLLKSIHDNLDDAKKGKSEAERISER